MSDCRCRIIGSTRDPYEPHIPPRPEWEQADDCPVHPLTDVAHLVTRSSLGTPEAEALRAAVSDEHAARILALAKSFGCQDCGCPMDDHNDPSHGGCTNCGDCEWGEEWL